MMFDLLSSILDLEQIDINLFRGVSPNIPGFTRIYGGQTIGQALVAAAHTVDPSFVVHSLHAYFLKPGDLKAPVLYQVDRIFDGKTFCNRRVRAFQKGKAIANLSASFHKIEKGLSHQEKMPPSVDPETLPSMKDIMKKDIETVDIPEKVRMALTRTLDSPFAMEMRRADDKPPGFVQPFPKSAADQRVWIRATHPINVKKGREAFHHQCAMAYMSDWSLLRTTLFPHGVSPYSRRIRMASVDHSMWFHAPFRADEWLLFHMTSPRAEGALGLAFGHVYRQDGTLVVSCAQEGLIRYDFNPQPRRSISSKSDAQAPPEDDASAAASSASASDKNTNKNKSKQSADGAVQKRKSKL